MAWRAVYDAQWGRDPVDVTTGDWAQAARILSAEVRAGLEGETCPDCRAEGEEALLLLSGPAGSEVEAEVDGELYRLTRV